MNKYTPEPWVLAENFCDEVCVSDGKSYVIANTAGWANDERSIADARRIVACVNACAGMTTEGLETFNVAKEMRELAEEREQYRTERADLLEALQLIHREVPLSMVKQYASRIVAKYKGDSCGSM